MYLETLLLLTSVQNVIALKLGHNGLPWYVHKEHLIHKFDNKAHEVRREDHNHVVVHDDRNPFLYVSNTKEIDPELTLPNSDLTDNVDFFSEQAPLPNKT
ncbi:hypothetical protein CSKR_112123 [Clonorchis sinensis]|uniref:Uncharacterized protein n=2 Tax=Clonorchis sinensis TaxID=79923 RepID=G7YJP6_CLOSI|nr:hypothetical protein CSKR_112123 [Clonorchis sinensis]GAA53183.1 hypothetical protein CLF_109718 [Clonorchis sinensis]